MIMVVRVRGSPIMVVAAYGLLDRGTWPLKVKAPAEERHTVA